ncbi:MAG: CBS domain-containing protein [Rhodothermia bacterium]|nr:MAG: CBS domain-containing protein [Rhodothermia bacterium]
MNTPVYRLIRSVGQVVSVRAEVAVDKAVKTMVDLNVGSVVVLDSDESLIGIFTERDLLRRVVGKNLIPGKTTIDSVMTRNVHVVDRSADRRDVHQLMDREHIRHVPIVDGGTVLGVVSLRDVLRSENAEKEFELTQLRGYVSDKPYPSYPG